MKSPYCPEFKFDSVNLNGSTVTQCANKCKKRKKSENNVVYINFNDAIANNNKTVYKKNEHIYLVNISLNRCRFFHLSHPVFL